MASLEHLDAVLGEALENITEAAREIRGRSEISEAAALKLMGHAIMEIWEVRDMIYQQQPKLMHECIVESKKNLARFEDLSELSQQAARAEMDGNKKTAVKLYTNLLKRSRFGHFRRHAEAGLYRVTKTEIRP